MTGERAKRFPLGLEDLVREPRRADARGAKAGAARPAASKPAATRAAVPNLNTQAADRTRSGVR